MKTEVTSVTSRPHPISNTFHLIMTILTGGLWIPIWIFMARGHKVTTRSPITGTPTPTAVTEGWTGQRLDPEYMAEHVPGSAEYKARHSESPEAEIGWGTQFFQDRLAAGDTRAQARHALVREIQQRNGG